MAPGADIKTTGPFNETSVSGVFAAGDAAGSDMASVVHAMHMGTFCGVRIVSQLQTELEPRDEL